MNYYDIYKKFYKDMKRKENEKVTDFINRFDMAANVAKQHKMELPPMVRGLKLLDDAGISDQDCNLVLSDINFNNEEEIYKQTKTGLAKYVRMDSEKSSSSSGIKLDSVFTASDEEALIAKGWSKNGNRGYKSAKGEKEKYKKP